MNFSSITKYRRLFAAALLSLNFSLLSGCSHTPDLSRYRDEQPRLDLREYFNGEVEAWGMFQNRSGEVIKRFTVRMQASWQGDQGELVEDFNYSDGSKQRRVWKIRRVAENQFEGRADDVVGVAQGQQSGSLLHWQYVLDLPVDNTSYQINFSDTMVLIDNKTMLNRAVLRKFGFEVGSVTLAFRKLS